MFNPIFNAKFKNVQGQKHPGGWQGGGGVMVAEPELLSHRKPKCVVQSEKNGHKFPIMVATNVVKKYNSIEELAKGTQTNKQNITIATTIKKIKC